MQNLYRIKNKEAQLVKFAMNPAQLDFHKKAHIKNIILKARQLGFTTYEVVGQLDDTLWHKNFDSLFISYDSESAIEIFDNKVDVAWINFPKALKSLLTVETDRANKLKFGFGDGTFSSIMVRTRGRSGTFHRLHISEFAKICKENPQKAKEIMRGTIPALPVNCRIDIESTAEGEFGYFHDMFWDAWDRGEPRNKSEWKAHFYNWTWDIAEIANIAEIPFEMMESRKFFEDYAKEHKLTQRQISYYYIKWLAIGKDFEGLRQEYPTTPEEAFLSSGRKMFDSTTVILHKKKYGRLPIREVDGIKFYDEPIKGHRYAIGVDVAEGIGADASAIVVMDFTYMPKVVCTYKNDKISPDNLAYIIRNIGRTYNEGLVAVERNNHGHATLVKLKEIYPHEKIYKQEIKDREEDTETYRLGWSTNLSSKPMMAYDFKTAFNDWLLTVPDMDLLLEIKTYDQDDLAVIRATKEQVKHWDKLIAAFICYQMRNHLEVEDFRDLQKKSDNKSKEVNYEDLY